MAKTTTTTRHVSAANAKRSSLASTLASSAMLRSKFGGGGAPALPARPVRGSTSWLRNRDAIATALDPNDQPRYFTRSSARFERRTSGTAEATKLREQIVPPPPPPPPVPAAKRQRIAAVPLPSAAVPGSTGGVEQPKEPKEPKEPKALRGGRQGGRKERTAEVDDGVSDVERIAWTTWHLTDAELAAAGYDPAVVRAPEVLALVRTRFLHSPNIMLNSNFDCNFSVDQGAFKRILRHKYGFMATYTPVKYPGMRCPFVLRRGVPLDSPLQTGVVDVQDKDLADSSPLFVGKYVKATLILFRTGNAFLRGSFSEEVMAFVYRRFERILADEYPRICTRYTCPDTKDANSVVKTRVAYFSKITTTQN